MPWSDNVTGKKRPYERQLRARLLCYNPWYRDRVASIRRDLGIPNSGFRSLSEVAKYTENQWGRRARLARIFQNYLRTLGEKDRGKELDQLMAESKTGPVKRDGLTVDLEAIEMMRREPSEEEQRGDYIREGILGYLAESMQYQKGIRLYDQAKSLIEDFDLPQSIFGSVVWHILTGESPWTQRSDTHIDTLSVFRTPLDYVERGISSIPPQWNSYFALSVDEYLTRQEFLNMWPQVRKLRDELCNFSGIRSPRGKRVAEMPREQLEEWLNI